MEAKGRKRKSDERDTQEARITRKPTEMICRKLGKSFFDVPCYNLANSLLGKILARNVDGEILRGKIVETECYLGGEDRASHSYNGRKTPGNEPMYMKPGTAYVYMTYGMYHCFNVSSEGAGAAVLLRALEPLQGTEKMKELRSSEFDLWHEIEEHSQILGKMKSAKVLKDHELCNGPSKLCMSLDIVKSSCNKMDLCEWDGMWIEDGGDDNDEDFTVVKTSRIGIDSAGEEWAKQPLRFYILGNGCVSKRDRGAEEKCASV